MQLFGIVMWLGWEQKGLCDCYMVFFFTVWLGGNEQYIINHHRSVFLLLLNSFILYKFLPARVRSNRAVALVNLSSQSRSLFPFIYSKTNPNWRNTPECEQKSVMQMIPSELFQSCVANPCELPSPPPISFLHPPHRLLPGSQCTRLLTTWKIFFIVADERSVIQTSQRN